MNYGCLKLTSVVNKNSNMKNMESKFYTFSREPNTEARPFILSLPSVQILLSKQLFPPNFLSYFDRFSEEPRYDN